MQISVVSLGSEGCIVRSKDGQKISGGAPKSKVVDTVGAGDYFTAGFLHAFLSGATLQVRM